MHDGIGEHVTGDSPTPLPATDGATAAAGGEAKPSAEPRVHIRTEFDPRINYAMQQNDVPVIPLLHVCNDTDEPVRDVEITIESEPDFADGWSRRIEAIAPRGEFTIEDVDLALSPSYLAAATEKARGCLRVTVRAEGDLLVNERLDVEILARDEWSGGDSLPEIIAAFVTPNHPRLRPVLQRAAQLLERETGDSSLSGYQQRSAKRVYVTAWAVYTAIQEAGLTYINPPASFEARGQRIRTAGRLFDDGMGTCLDLAVLTASCLEQCGLHPLLVLTQGHAFTGVWLEEDCLPDAVAYEALPLRKALDLGRLSVFDPTLATRSDRPSFDGAIVEARQRLARDEEFAYVVDIRRARIGRITPLSERVEGVEPDGSQPEQMPGPGPAPLPDLSELDRHEELDQADASTKDETPIGRLERWQNKLLDLSLRNRLLNFKTSNKKVVPLLCPDVGALEDGLASGEQYPLGARPGDLADGDPRDRELYRRRTGGEALDAIVAEEFEAGRLHADLDRDETSKRLTAIYRAARLALEEGGSNELFLAVGQLKWFESDTSDTKRLAPLILMPVRLIRRSVQEGFQLVASDDDPTINVTLLEKLERDFGIRVPGLDPLPQDESGIDIPLILRKFKRAVERVPRWEVLESVSIGLFSFTKFLMWRDLTARTDDLLQSPVVDHLVNRPREPYPKSGEFQDAARLDQERHPTEVFCPMSADSSQLAAVMAAADGQSFVLEGPPGTGKSQTITNLIAHCLATGKRVLFVSEKMAALDVVHRRLSQIGLGRFCLELHSNKASKADVYAQLKTSLEEAAQRAPVDWEREAERLERLRNDLNTYVEALHRKHTSGETVFEVTARLTSLRHVERLPLHWSNPDDIDAMRLTHLRDTVEALRVAAEACGGVADHPWRAVRHAEWKPGWQGDALERVEGLVTTTSGLRGALVEGSEALGLDPETLSRQDLGLVAGVCSALLEHPGPPKTLLEEPAWDDVEERLSAWIAVGRERDAQRARVFEEYVESVCDLDVKSLASTLRIAEASAWPLSWWRCRPVVAALRAERRSGKAPHRNALAEDLEAIAELQAKEAAVGEAGDDARRLLERHWRDGEADWDGLSSIRDWARRFRHLARDLGGGDVERVRELTSRWARLATEESERLAAGQPLRATLQSIVSGVGDLEAALEVCRDRLDLDADVAWGGVDEAGVLARVEDVGKTWARQASRLKDWCHWRRERARAAGEGLLPLLEAAEAGAVEPSEWLDVFERSYSQWWYEAILDREPVLAGFSSAQHEHAIREFRNTDERYTQLTEQVIAARLAAKTPSANANVKTSEIGILTREVNKKRRHMPVRKLFQQTPNVLARLKPCLLMSPISIAQYLDPSYPPFDVVVFDEASQIPVWDAVGALARGKQAVIVGDPKQLPPTSFFQRTEDDEDEERPDDFVEDMESILDDCMAAQLPWLHLDWHYRSRHESLITFSNHHYYDNNLLTFPAAVREGLGVSWRHVPDGVYDRGKSRTNRVEADELVAEIVKRLKDPAHKDITIGVVTFSQTQQKLVEDLLDAARRDHPEIEFAFDEGRQESVFVKNLENVQGDERDVILFSIGYGPDAEGRTYMNFGPLTGKGGERRLNVAITRARREVVVFSTLRPEHIDLKKTRARGVRDLKTFLDFAERGSVAIAEATDYRGLEDFESPFEEQVAKALSDRGWEVHAQVGCSSYRVDLAVVDPEAPGRYLLGVECDGAAYHSAKTARDRDRLRQLVLEGLGWTLHRIWSSDWWNDPKREIEKVEEALRSAQDRRRRTRDEAVEPEPSSTPERLATASTAKPAEKAPSAVAGGGAGTPERADSPQRDEVRARETPEPAHEPAPRIATYSVGRGVKRMDVSDIYEPRAHRLIVRRFEEVVATEAPVLFELAAKRVGEALGMGRVTSKAVEHMRLVLDRSCRNARVVARQDTSAGELLLWRPSDDPQAPCPVRKPGYQPEEQRKIHEIPMLEIAASVEIVVEEHISLPELDLAREAARLLGVKSLGSKVKARMDAAIDRCVEDGRVKRDGEMIVAGGEDSAAV